MYPNCNRPQFTNQICNVSPMRSIGQIHAGYILNVPHFSDVIVLCPKWGRSIKLGTLRSHDWVHSKSDQHFPQEQIKTTFMGTFSINPTFAHWAHWSHLLPVLPMYPACAWWVFGSCQGGPRRSPEIQSTLVWSSCWGATGSARRSTQRGEQRRIVRTRGNKGEVGVTRDQCRVW